MTILVTNFSLEVKYIGRAHVSQQIIGEVCHYFHFCARPSLAVPAQCQL